jgi:hypothetical protein
MNSPSGTDSSNVVSVAFDIENLPGSTDTVVKLEPNPQVSADGLGFHRGTQTRQPL